MLLVADSGNGDVFVKSRFGDGVKEEVQPESMS